MNTLERLKELEEKATHGPWRWHLAYGSGFIGTSKDSANDVACAVSSEDCELIVEMRNALPKLLALVDEAISAYPGIGSLFGDGRGLRKALEDLGVEFEE